MKHNSSIQMPFRMILALVAALVIGLSLAACSDDAVKDIPKKAEIPYNSSISYEITKDDFFSKKGWTSKNIMAYGFKLGDTESRMVEKLGTPDLKTEILTGTNYEYSKALGMKMIGILIRFDKSGKAVSMTFKPPFNDKMVGETKISHDKDYLYKTFGRPGYIQLLSKRTVYGYPNRGIDIIMDAKKENGFMLYTEEGQIFYPKYVESYYE